MYTKLIPERLDGFPFAGRDLQSVVSWAKARSDGRLDFTADDTEVQGVTEIYPADAAWPRWCLWQTPDGRLQVDDLETGDLGPGLSDRAYGPAVYRVQASGQPLEIRLMPVSVPLGRPGRSMRIASAKPVPGLDAGTKVMRTRDEQLVAGF